MLLVSTNNICAFGGLRRLFPGFYCVQTPPPLPTGLTERERQLMLLRWLLTPTEGSESSPLESELLKAKQIPESSLLPLLVSPKEGSVHVGGRSFSSLAEARSQLSKYCKEEALVVIKHKGGDKARSQRAFCECQARSEGKKTDEAACSQGEELNFPTSANTGKPRRTKGTKAVGCGFVIYYNRRDGTGKKAPMPSFSYLFTFLLLFS